MDTKSIELNLTNPKNWITASRIFLLKLFMFVIFSFYLLYQLFYNVEPIIQGDGFEYVLMTESFYNHFTPDLTEQDLTTAKNNLINSEKYNDWNSFHINALTESFKHKEFLYVSYGYYSDLDGDKYSYHFWTYSLLSVPFRFIIDLTNGNIEKIHLLMNWLIFIVTCFYLLFKSTLPTKKSLPLLLFYIFSPVYWYLFFSGPEILASSLCFLCLVLFYEKKYYLSVLCASIACTHFPPIFLLALFVAIKALFVKGFNFKNIALLFLVGLPCIIPSLFYLYNFHIPNLIIHSGYLKENLFTFTRFFGVFFDLNQGIFLGIPALLFIFIFIYFRNLFKGKWSYDLLLLPVVLGMICGFINMFLWNNAIMMLRYGVWCCIPLLVYPIMNANFNLKSVKILFAAALIIHALNIFDAFRIFKMGGLQVNSNQSVTHNKIARWVLSNYPEFYNPDPIIYGRRTLWGKHFDRNDSPICYYSPEWKLRKAMVHRSKVHELPPDIYTKEKIENLNFINDWAYINF